MEVHLLDEGRLGSNHVTRPGSQAGGQSEGQGGGREKVSEAAHGFEVPAAGVQEVAVRFHALFLAWIHVGQVLCSSRLQLTSELRSCCPPLRALYISFVSIGYLLKLDPTFVLHATPQNVPIGHF